MNSRLKCGTTLWWTPQFPYTSSLDGTTASAFAANYKTETGNDWTQPMGFNYAVFEIAVAALKASGDPTDKAAVASAIGQLKGQAITGAYDFTSGPAPPDPILEVTGLDVFYGDFQALFGVWMSVAGGRATALVGANGAGKTTLLRTIAGAQPPAAGSVRYRGRDLTGAPPHLRISAGIALVPEGRRLFPSLTVEENIQVGAAAAASADWPLMRIYDVFPMLARRRGQRASTLSGGEQQAVAIARALAAVTRDQVVAAYFGEGARPRSGGAPT